MNLTQKKILGISVIVFLLTLMMNWPTHIVQVPNPEYDPNYISEFSEINQPQIDQQDMFAAERAAIRARMHNPEKAERDDTKPHPALKCRGLFCD